MLREHVRVRAASTGNGLSPEQARLAALDVAAELDITVRNLRRLARADLSAAECRALAAELAA